MNTGKVVSDIANKVTTMKVVSAQKLEICSDIEKLLERFGPREKENILSCVNESNQPFLTKLLSYKYDGERKLPDYGITMVLRAITPDNSIQAEKIISKLKDGDCMPPYYIVEEIKKESQKIDVCHPNRALVINPKQILLESKFGQIIKEIHLSPSSNPKVIELESKLRKLGIQVKFCDDEKTAQATYNMCKKLYDKGIELPKEIIFMTPQSASVYGFTPFMKKGMEKYAQIFLNKDLFLNPPKADSIFERDGIRHFTVLSPEGTFEHELGHWYHNQNLLPDTIAQNVWRKYLPSYQDELKMAREVSAHAALCDCTGKEFCAEVFAGLINGDKYSERVMKLYSELNGSIPHCL